MKTIDDLKVNGFTVGSNVRCSLDSPSQYVGKRCIEKYTFTFENGQLYVSGGYLGKTKYLVMNHLQVLFDAAKGSEIEVIIPDSRFDSKYNLRFTIWNPKVRLIK